MRFFVNIVYLAVMSSSSSFPAVVSGEASITLVVPTMPLRFIENYDSSNVSVNVSLIQGNRSTCASGFVCNSTHQASCEEIREAAIHTFGFGDIHAGSYCPEGIPYYLNCKVGHYCPDSTQQLTCPPGYFCPDKTAVPSIACSRCRAGATELEVDLYGFILLALLAVLPVAIFLGNLVVCHFTHGVLANRVASVIDVQGRAKERSDKIRRLRPKLQLICDRIVEMTSREEEESSMLFIHDAPSNHSSESTLISSSDLTLKSSKGSSSSTVSLASPKISKSCVPVTKATSRRSSAFVGLHSFWVRSVNTSGNFNVNAVFDALDKDENGVLDYDELNHVLQMDYSELQEFVRRMNATERGSTAATHVSRKSFCRNFLAVLEQVSNFQMTREEAGSRWDAMADVFGADANNELDPEHLYESTIADFLDDVQISDLIKGLRREKATELLTAPVQDPTRPQDRYRRKNSRVKSVFGPSRTKGIDRNLFCEHFPKLLEETLVKGLNRDRHATKNQGIDIAFQNLQLSVVLGHGKSTNVVDKVSGRMKRGTMTAVIGGSGCGKTSLLNALCGRAYYGEVNGTIYINGNPACIDDFRDSVGFVPQDDIVFAELTVRENLMYSGRFRLPRKTPFNEVEELANRVMANLGLIRKAQCVVGDVNRRGISGGEKKRVSIGLELMARPTALFLDEPTSGLDASSALLVMTSLKQLVQNEGATICSVIHQPRKFIFYLFDSLILLGVGGRTVYHGPVDEAESYFEQLNYRLPIGESLSDFLIDISTGRIEPCTESGPEAAINAESIREKSYRITQVVNPSAKKRDEEDDDAKMRVHRLFDYWDAHTSGIKDFERSELSAPEPYDMPEHFVAPSFFRQFQWQLQRMFLVAWRNRISKAWDTAIIVLAFAFITFFDGTVTPTTEKTPLIPFEVLVSNQSEVHEQFFPSLFEFAVNSTVGYLRYGIHIGIISAVLVALTAVKNVTEKRLENFREASSGINVTAYFVALNVFTTIEQGLQVMLGAVIAQWLRHSIANKATFYAAFLVLTWITLSWTLLIPLIVPPKNTILALGFFMGFFGLMFGGASPPVEYPEIYKEGNAAIALVSAFFSPTRFFTETLIVSDQKCLPPQTGFTQAEDTYDFPQHLDSFSLIQMGQLDSSVNTPSCSGWYWGILPAVLVGFTVRFAALGCVNCLNRSQQAKKSFWFQLRHQGSVRLYASTALFCICLVALVVLTSWTVLRSV